jgi:NAD-dependent SIR2 family protein deacetylase
MHGELLKSVCANCGHITELRDEQTISQACSTCGMQSLRPDIVWFGEAPKYMDKISDALSQCELFVSIGTSGNVYPAAGFVECLVAMVRIRLRLIWRRLMLVVILLSVLVGRLGLRWCGLLMG